MNKTMKAIGAAVVGAMALSAQAWTVSTDAGQTDESSSLVDIVGYEKSNGGYTVYYRLNDPAAAGHTYTKFYAEPPQIQVGEVPADIGARTETDLGAGGAIVSVWFDWFGEEDPYLSIYFSGTSGEAEVRSLKEPVLFDGTEAEFLAGPEFIPVFDVAGPIVLNGRLLLPLDANYNYHVQKWNFGLGEWEGVSGMSWTADYNRFLAGPDQSLRGESKWRIAYGFGTTAPVLGWTEFTVDANKPLSGAATDPGDYGAQYDAVNAFDGNTRSFYHSLQYQPYTTLNMDFGEAKVVGGIKYHLLYDWPARFGHGTFEIANSEDFSDAVTLYEVPKAQDDAILSYLNHEDGAQLVCYYEVTLDHPMKGRYVRYVANSDLDYINLAELEFDEGEIPEDVPDVEMWETPFAINGRLNIPLGGDAGDFALQRFAGGEWTDEPMAEGGNFKFSAENALIGVGRWRIGRRALRNLPPEKWVEFEVDARCAMACSPFSDSPVWGNDYANYGVANAVDGKVTTIFHPREQYSAEQANQWIGIDFGGVRTITQFSYCPTVDNGGAYVASGERTLGCVLQYAEDRAFANPTTVYTVTEADKGKFIVTHDFPEPFSARYVRMKPMTDGMWFNLAEIEFAGSSDSADLTVSAVDPATGYPTLGYLADYVGAYGVSIFRADRIDGVYRAVATLGPNATSWTDSDRHMKFGRTYYYKIARRDASGNAGSFSPERVPYTRVRWLERNAAGNVFADGVSLYCPHLPESFWYGTTYGYPAEWAFDGTYRNPDIWTDYSEHNPGIGVDFGADAKVHVARVEFQATSGIIDRSWNLTVYGAKEIDESQFPYGGTRICDSATPTSLQQGEWTTLECDSTEDYRYLYMMRPDNTAWYGYAAEIQFWGWDEADIDQDGIVIFVR